MNNKSFATDDCYEDELDYPGNDIKVLYLKFKPEDCLKACETEHLCKYWTWHKFAKRCNLKKESRIGNSLSPNIVSGPKRCHAIIGEFNRFPETFPENNQKFAFRLW